MQSFTGIGSPACGVGRCHSRASLSSLFGLVAMSTLAGGLVACGGGGGAAAPEPAPAPAPAPAPLPTTPIAAQMTVPTPVGYDADRLAAFNRLNEIRLSAGLGMVAQNTMMDQAAQAHAEWMVVNNTFAHTEAEGTPGFTGETWARRDEAFGYVPVGGSEVMSYDASGEMGVGALINMVSHRSGMLAFEPVDVGIGWSAKSGAVVSTPLVIDMTRPATESARGLGQAAQAAIHGVCIWPLDGARDVPLRMGLEIPNPVPAQDVLSLGTPVSLNVDESRTLSAIRFTLTNMLTGTAVTTKLLMNQNDASVPIPASFIAAIPLAPLSPNTTYEADFSGSTVQFPSGLVEAVNRTWSFTTGAR